MRGVRNRIANSLFVAALFQLRFCTGEDTCRSVAAQGKDLGCTETFRAWEKVGAQDLSQELARLLYTSSSSEQLFTWLVPTDGVLDDVQFSQDALDSRDANVSPFSRIVPIVGTVPVPEPGTKVEAQTLSGDAMWLAADASGTVTVSSSASSSVAILHTGAPEASGAAVNIQSCTGLMHVVSAVHEVVDASEEGAGAADMQLIAGAKHASGVLSTVPGGEQAWGARRLLSRLEPSSHESALEGKLRGILQFDDFPADVQLPNSEPLPETPPGAGGGEEDATTPELCEQGTEGCSDICFDTRSIPEVPDTLPDMVCECETADCTPVDAPASVREGLEAVASAAASPNTVDISGVGTALNVTPGTANATSAELNATAAAAAAPAPAPASETPTAAAGAASGDNATEAAAAPAGARGKESEDSQGFFTSIPFYAIVAACAAAIIACLCCGICIRHRKKSRADGGRDGDGAFKQVPMTRGGGPDMVEGALPNDGSHFDNNYTNSMHLRNAQAPAPMALPPSPHMGKPEMEMQAPLGHQPDAHYGAPVHSRGYRGAPDAFGAVSGGYDAPPSLTNSQPAPPANGKFSEPQHVLPAVGVGAAPVWGATAAQASYLPQKAMTPRGDDAANAAGPKVSATAPIAGVHANKDIKEKKKRIPDSQKRALKIDKAASGAKHMEPLQAGMPTASAQRSKRVLAAQPLPIMANVGVAPETQSEISKLEQKLASFGPHAELGGRYRLINNVCLAKESSVVVNAQGVKDNLKYTITFFLNRAHFDVERGLYSTAPLKGLVPRAHVHDESDPLTAPDGSALPRSIVLERGETVAEWAVRRAPDANVKAEVLRHIALRVRALHEAGYVHCNLSPEAFKWYPRENLWMLCEFGHAARAGDARRAGPGGLSDTKITYAAPEGVAIDDGTKSLRLRNDVVAKAGLDVWSYAVVALEIMFGSPLLDSSNEKEVREQLGNQTPLPWEDDRMRAMIVNTVGDSYAGVLLEALQRNDSARPSMSALHDSWRSAQRTMRSMNEQDQSVSDLL